MLLTTQGPVNCRKMNTSRSETAASSSARVGGRRTLVNCGGAQPPMAVMNWPAGTLGRHAARICWMSAIESALSIGV